MQTKIDAERIHAVTEACDKEAWLFAESGGTKGYVQVVYRPSRRQTSEQIFARVVRLWRAIDRPNAQISLVNVGNAQGAVRRAKNTPINLTLLRGSEAVA